MKLDLHVHSHYSGDAGATPKEIVEAACARGLDGLAIADHNSIEGSLEAVALGRSSGIIVIPAIEVSSDSGHILAYGVRERVERGLSVEDTVERIEALGGVAVAAHPYRAWSGLGEDAVRRGQFRVVETMNARSTSGGNGRAERLAQALKAGRTGGSDAHGISEIGAAYTVFSGAESAPDDLVESIAKGRTEVGGRSRSRAKSFGYAARCVRLWILRGMRRI